MIPVRTKSLALLRLFAILALVLVAFLSALFYLGIQRASWNPLNLRDDPVTNWEARCEGLKQDLPTHGQIGYLSDWDLPGWDGSISDMDNEFRLTQYALVPRIIVRGANFPLIIGNFTSDETIQAAETQYSLEMVRSYGLGIYLFKKAAQ
jgi:hypothetical protein